MSQIITIAVIASLVALLMAVPITDIENQRNTLYPGIKQSHKNVKNSLEVRPIHLRDNTGLHCPKAGFFVNPRNCSRFYRCVDVAETGYFSIFNFECPTKQIFYEDTSICVPGACTSTSLPVSIMPPGAPADTPHPADQPEINPAITFPPAPPPPPPSTPVPPPPPSTPVPPPPPSSSPPPLSPQPTEIGPESEEPDWLSEVPTWFYDTPWWFKTPPAWFHQPPAWFNAPPASHVIEEVDISIDDSEPVESYTDNVTGENTPSIVKQISPENFSMSGIDHTFLYDNKTIRIHIPIHIVQQ